ncbi:hypothetical protein [Acetobacterium sp. UBA5834]|jgi:glycine cleavage system aminomethyltransferase T|uniref:hypothetical protein n=1 Tax=Acetobacterium sp. UBA5834 TaxID=1945907 RepID=UPI00257D9DED|nr:hypothetical protein [Acetobacterium sp. UBA5834]
MNSENTLKFVPHIPNNVPEVKVMVAPEGLWHPMTDGTWPLHPFAYDKWEIEELSWHDTCYIHAGLNPFLQFAVKGSDLLDLMEAISVNTFRNFPVGKARHTLLCNDLGKIILDGIIIRRSEEDFICACLPDPAMFNAQMENKFKISSEYIGDSNFFFQMCGPKSLQIVEEAAQQDLHDLKFMFTADAKIAGKEVFVLRTGMAGTLGYEVHGKVEDAHEVYNKLLEVGEKYGIQKLGRYAYVNAHCEGSIPQIAEHFASPMDPVVLSGSLPRDSELLYRSPVDLGWEKLIKFNHDFPGKDALKKELEGPHNTGVHLIWNKEDVLKVMAGSMDHEKRYDTMDLVCDYDYVRNNAGMHIDAVFDGEKMIGASSGRMLSPKTREMISIGSIDSEYAVEGKEVEVLWGNPESNQVRVRVTVTLFPYIKEGRNEDFDTETIPHSVFD